MKENNCVIASVLIISVTSANWLGFDRDAERTTIDRETLKIFQGQLSLTHESDDFTVGSDECDCTEKDNNAVSCNLMSKKFKFLWRRENLYYGTHSKNLSCVAIFQSMHETIINSKIQCVSVNAFLISDDNKNSDASMNMAIKCVANKMINFSFNGNMPSDAMNLSFWREYGNNEVKTGNSFQMVLKANMKVIPEISGHYAINLGNDSEDVITFDIFVQKSTGDNYLMNSGKTLFPLVINQYFLLLPCRSILPGVKLLLKKDGVAVRGHHAYSPPHGIFIQLLNNEITSAAGLYECVPDLVNLSDMPNPSLDYLEINVSTKTLQSMTEARNKALQVSLQWSFEGDMIKCLTKVQNDTNDFVLAILQINTLADYYLKMTCMNADNACPGLTQVLVENCDSHPKSCKQIQVGYGGGYMSCFGTDLPSPIKISNDFVFGFDRKLYLNPLNVDIPSDALLAIEITGNENGILYTNVMYDFTCISIAYMFLPPLEMSVIGPNGVIIHSNSTESAKDSSLFKIRIRTSFASKGLIQANCKAFFWKMSGSKKQLTSLQVEESQAPQFESAVENVTYVPKRDNILECDYVALPIPFIRWEKDGMRLNTSNRVLKLSPDTSVVTGIYTCFANNDLGFASKSFSVTVLKDNVPLQSNLWATYGTVFGILGVGAILGTSLSVWYYYSRQKKGLSSKEYRDFITGNASSAEVDPKSNDDFTFTIPFPKEYEIEDKDFSLDETKVLGSGCHGIIYTGKIGTLTVAIKTLRRNSNREHFKSLLNELKLMVYLDHHPCLLKFFGANISGLKAGSIYIMTEFCSLGNLEKYLRENRGKYLDILNPSDYCNSQPVVDVKEIEFDTRQLLLWSIDISHGMDYLSSKKVIHGDIAARNILLIHSKAAKISDFGLSRKLYQLSNYMKSSQEPLPWRHMAVESLRDMAFSTASDVWSFGITLWEIFSLGLIPYPGLAWDANFINQLEIGLRMQKPSHANDYLYSLMLSCWHLEFDERPSFTDLSMKLKLPLDSLDSQ